MFHRSMWVLAVVSALAILVVAGPATASPAAPTGALSNAGATPASRFSAYMLSFGHQAFAQYGMRVDNASPSSIPLINPLLLGLARQGHAQNIQIRPDGTIQLLADEHAASALKAAGVALAGLAPNSKQANLPAVSIISGTVTGSGGSPLSGAVVSAVLGSSVLTATTDLSGAYQLTATTAGDYEVGAYADGYEWQPSVTVAVPSGAIGVNFALVPQNQTIRGNVSSDTGPIAGAEVYAYELAQDNFTAGDSTTTDASGNYTLTVSAGTYDVRAFAPPLGVQSRTVQVPPSASGKDFHFTSQTLYRVSGTVRKAGGQPLPGGELTFTNNDVAINTCDAPYSQAPTAGADGTYSTLLPQGNYSVSANWPNEWTDHWVIGASGSLEVTGDVSGFDLTLPAVATIRGTVTNPSGQPLANATVFSWRGDPNASPSFDGFFPTDASGNYVVTATLGAHNLFAFSNSFTNSTTQSVTLTGNRTGVNMQVRTGIQVGGQLTGSDSQPLRWASLLFKTTATGVQPNRYGTVYYNGTWKAVVAQGNYVFYASQPMYYDRNRQVNVRSNPSPINLTLPRKTQRLVGKANLVIGSGLCDTFITASNVSTGDSTGGSSTGDGDYALMVSSGTYNVFPYKYNSDSSSFNSRVTVPPVPASVNFTVTEVIFHDVMTDTYFYQPVAFLVYSGIASGYTDGTYRPYNDTTRGQLAKLVVNAEGWAIDTTGGPHFTDVPVSNPFYSYIETAYHHGVISGYGDNTFRWGNNITRAQLSKVIVGSEGWSINTRGGPHFTDVPTSDPFYGYIETAFGKGVISGYADRTFRPGNNAIRGQIAKIVYNAVTQP